MPLTKKTTTPKIDSKEFSRTWDDEKSYKHLKTQKDLRFGDVNLLKHSVTGDVIFQREKLFTSKKEATLELLKLQKRMGLNHPNLLQMLTYTCTRQKKLCSSNYLIKSFYKYPSHDMNKLLLDHKRNLTSFSAFELHKMKHNMLSALNVLHGAGLSHGDIRPEYIGYDKKTDQYVLLDRFSYGLTGEKFQSDHLLHNREIFMSPGLYSKL